jgi:signal recognition particle GTPase
VGLGENAEDLVPFDAREFVKGMLGEGEGQGNG